MITQSKNQVKTDQDVRDMLDEGNKSSDMDLSRAEWLRIYSHKLLTFWHKWQTPLGVASAYARQIQIDLTEFYDDPLKRAFIEATYS